MEGPDSNTDEQRHGVQRSGRTLDPVLASRRGHRCPRLFSAAPDVSEAQQSQVVVHGADLGLNT